MAQSDNENTQIRVLSVKKTIEILNVGLQEFYNKHRKNVLPTHKIGKGAYYQEDIVLKYKEKINNKMSNLKIVDNEWI